MPKFQLYDSLLQFPLFQGMSLNDFTQVISHTKLGFHKFRTGATIAKIDTPCERLCFALSGTIDIITPSSNYGYTFIEPVATPVTFQLDRIFGLSQRYSHTYRAHSDCSVITLDKSEIYHLFDTFVIFRINFINALATQIQKQAQMLWRKKSPDTHARIIEFLKSHCRIPAGEKHVSITMTRLADEINDSRLNVSQALNHMQADGLVTLSRGRIHVPAMEKL